MAEKKIRKVISRVAVEHEVLKEEKAADGVKTEQTGSFREAGRAKKACFFCQSGKEPSYTDMAVLKRYTTDRAKIVPKAKSSLCSRHQRIVTKQIKYARHLALLPFVPRV